MLQEMRSTAGQSKEFTGVERMIRRGSYKAYVDVLGSTPGP